MTAPEIVSLLMFGIVGGTLADLGAGITDKPVHFLLIMICMSAVKLIG